MREQVEKTVEVIRPALRADGGDIILHGVDEESGVITVELIGACVGCPASTQTLKAGIERIMRDRIDGVTEVVNLGVTPRPGRSAAELYEAARGGDRTAVAKLLSLIERGGEEARQIGRLAAPSAGRPTRWGSRARRVRGRAR